MVEILENLFQVILFFSAGYFSRKSKILEEETAHYLIKFIIYISFPALVIYNVYYLHLNLEILNMIVAGWIVILFSIVFSFFVGQLLKLDKKSHAAFIMMATFGNTSFLGFPFVNALLGEENLKYAVVFDQLASFLPLSLLSGFILSYGSGKSKKFDIKKVLTFPPFIALVFGLVVSHLVNIPEFVLISLKNLGDTVIPLALFSIGMNFRFSGVIGNLKNSLVVLFIKMIFVPVIFLGILKIFTNDLSMIWKTTIIEISMPPMVLASVLVINEKLDKELAVSSVGVGIIISFITVPFIFKLISL
jgi:hypothetical protein